MDKQWRIQDTETFVERSLEYLAPMVSKFMMHKYPYSCKEKERRVTNLLAGITSNRIKRAKTIPDKMDLVRDMLKIALEDVKDWSEFSMDPNSSLDDIILRSLLSEIFGVSFVCYSYLSKNPNLPEEFVRDLSFIHSGLFKFEDFDDEHVDAINTLLEVENITPYDVPELRKLYGLKSPEDKLLKTYTSRVGAKLGINAPKMDFRSLASASKKNYSARYKNLYSTYSYFKGDDELEQ